MEQLQFYKKSEKGEMSQVHPLLNKVILDIVFGKGGLTLSSGTLAQLRRVCILWRDYFSKRWRNSAQLTLTIPQRCRWTITYDKQPPSKLSLVKFIELHRNDSWNLRTNPFKSYKLKGLNFDGSVEADIYYLWGNIGPIVSRLQLEECTSEKLYPRELFDILSRKTPQLEELSINNCYFNRGTERFNSVRYGYGTNLHNNVHLSLPNPGVRKLEIMGHLPFLMWDSPYLLPAVESIKVNDRDGVRYIIGVLTAVETPDRPHRCTGLKAIDIIDLSSERPPQGEIFLANKISQLDLPLEELRIRLTFPPQSISLFLFRRILDKHFRTLRKLEIHQKLACELHFFPYQFIINRELEALEELSLHGFIAATHIFMRNAPNLKKLHVDVDAYEVWKGEELNKEERRILSFTNRSGINWNERRKQEMFKNVEECHLHSLSYLHVDKMISIATLTALSICAPGLKSFHLVSDNPGVTMISRHWPQLVELKLLFGSLVDDGGITGRRQHKFSPFRPQNLLPQHLTASSLCSMQSLKSFGLEAECDKGKLTANCVFEGFLKMKSLIFLDISVSPEMTEKAEQLLLENIPNVRIHRNYGENHQGSCCRRQSFNRLIQQALEYSNV